MKHILKKLFYNYAYLDVQGSCKKEDTYFYRFSHQIGQTNLRMMRSMSIFMLIICFFVIGSTFTYFETVALRRVYIPIVFFELIVLCLLQVLLKKTLSFKTSTTLTALHLFHMLAISGYIGVVYCQNETALIYVVCLIISSVIFTLPTMLTVSISTICTIAMIIASYYIKESYWFESDMLNGICVLFFSFLFGFKINKIRVLEAFARADTLTLNEELKKISTIDALTGLYNHRSFQDNYYEMFHRARTMCLPIGLIMMDLDEFKAYNDNYGHVAGDACLARVASAISDCMPKGAIACRYGGEEFIVLLNEDSCHDAKEIGEKIRCAVVALEIPHAHCTFALDVVTLSLGAYVGTPTQNNPPMDFVDRADMAMYQSKSSGRNCLTMSKQISN